MDRIPSWALMLATLVLAGFAVWSGLDQNWSGLIVSLVLAAICVAALVRAPGRR